MDELKERFKMEGATKELTKDIVDERLPPTFERDSDQFINDGCEVGELTRREPWEPPVFEAEFEGSIYEPQDVLWEIDTEAYFAQLWLSEITSDGRVAFSWFMGSA